MGRQSAGEVGGPTARPSLIRLWVRWGSPWAGRGRPQKPFATSQLTESGRRTPRRVSRCGIPWPALARSSISQPKPRERCCRPLALFLGEGWDATEVGTTALPCGHHGAAIKATNVPPRQCCCWAAKDEESGGGDRLPAGRPAAGKNVGCREGRSRSGRKNARLGVAGRLGAPPGSYAKYLSWRSARLFLGDKTRFAVVFGRPAKPRPTRSYAAGLARAPRRTWTCPPQIYLMDRAAEIGRSAGRRCKAGPDRRRAPISQVIHASEDLQYVGCSAAGRDKLPDERARRGRDTRRPRPGGLGCLSPPAQRCSD